MFFKIVFATSLLVQVGMAMELNEGMIDKERDERISEVLVDINANSKRFQEKRIMFQELSDDELKGIVPLSEKNSSNKYERMGIGEMIRHYEKKMLMEKKRKHIIETSKKVNRQLAELERDITSANKIQFHVNETETQIITEREDSIFEVEDKKIEEHLVDLESILNKLKSNPEKQKKEYEIFKHEASETERVLMDMLVKVERINGNDDLVQIYNKEMDYIKSKDRGFDEIMNDFNQELILSN